MKYTYLMISMSLMLVLFTSCRPSTLPSPTTPPPIPTPTPPLEEKWTADGIIKVREYYGSNNYGDFTIFWRSDEQNIYIGITAKTSGWVAMALQPGSRMKEADMILGFIEGGSVTIQDQFSTGDFGPHFLDKDQGGTDDILEFGGKEERGYTTIEFKRALTTGDRYDIAISNGANKIIWAYGPNDNPAVKHSSRGYGEIIL